MQDVGIGMQVVRIVVIVLIIALGILARVHGGGD